MGECTHCNLLFYHFSLPQKKRRAATARRQHLKVGDTAELGELCPDRPISYPEPAPLGALLPGKGHDARRGVPCALFCPLTGSLLHSGTLVLGEAGASIPLNFSEVPLSPHCVEMQVVWPWGAPFCPNPMLTSFLLLCRVLCSSSLPPK